MNKMMAGRESPVNRLNTTTAIRIIGHEEMKSGIGGKSLRMLSKNNEPRSIKNNPRMRFLLVYIFYLE
jgi:hypothetical protein